MVNALQEVPGISRPIRGLPSYVQFDKLLDQFPSPKRAKDLYRFFFKSRPFLYIIRNITMTVHQAWRALGHVQFALGSTGLERKTRMNTVSFRPRQ